MIHILFLVSGALGLVYEVLWMRQFTALFGGTVLATTAVLSAFFLGTAAGSAVLGRRARACMRPVQLFGLLEMGVGMGALLVRPILHLYQALYPQLYVAFGASPSTFTLIKLALAVIAIGPATFFMGGTLPVLAESVSPEGKRLGLSAGGLYVVNVVGAALGALAVPFVLLPWLGLYGAALAAAGGSLTVGATAWVLGARVAAQPSSLPAPSVVRPGPVSPNRVLVFAFWSGLCTLALEVLWTRMFSLVHENSVYPFALVVVVFLAGLSLGAGVARRGLRLNHVPERLLGIAWSLAGASIAVSPALFHLLTGGLEYLPATGSLAALARLTLLGVCVMLPACVALGVALPSLMEMTDVVDSTGSRIGRLLAVNTLGAILGPVAVTFAIAPALGLWRSIVLFGVATAVAAQALPLKRRERWACALAVALVLVVLRPTELPAARVRSAEGERAVSVREGSYGTTAVIADAHDRWITVNNSYVLGGLATAPEERWQGHLALLLHPRARRVAYIGMGTAITAGAARLHPVDEIVALEIVPEVATAARADFGDVNGGLLEDRRTHVVIDDGRNYLSSVEGGFDVIVGDLLVPWRPAEAPLYSREYLQSVRRALAPRGVFCEWLPLYQLSEDQLQILLRTFLDVFPRATLWRGSFLPEEPTLALVGHLGTEPLEARAIDEKTAAVAPSLLDVDVPFLRDPAGPWLFLVGALRPGAPWLSEGPRNRDDRPWIELSSREGKHLFAGAALEAFLDKVAAEPWSDTPLGGLDAAHRAWRDTGRALSRASLTPGLEGEARVLAILRTLPAPLQRALGVAQASE